MSSTKYLPNIPVIAKTTNYRLMVFCVEVDLELSSQFVVVEDS